MELQEIDVFIEKDGSVKIQVRGMKGEGCLELTKPLEDALGGQIESREMTADYYETTNETIENEQWQYGG